jgi:aminobenzoyl-glutamate utilization protein B
MENIKDRLISKVDEYRDEMIHISKCIYNYSELSFNEYKSSKLLADTLEKYGFSVERGLAPLTLHLKLYTGVKRVIQQ